MKKLFLFAIMILSAALLQAQPWMPAGKGPVKLQDAINNYAKHPLAGDADEEQVGDVKKEGKDYLFDRWVWFWKEHLDSNGYMVSPVKTFNEWEAYRHKNDLRSAARTTSAAADTANWVFEGPSHSGGGYAGIGRINVIAFHPTDANTFYIGSAGGGTWKTTDNGATWTPLYNALLNMGVSDIKVNPRNPNTVYVCTGDADGYDEYSIGVIKSTDGGATWENTGMIWTPTDYAFARSLIINPVDTNVLTLATNTGIYKSTDAGATWTNILSGDFKQLLYNPADTNIVYATDYESVSSQILRSHDAGNTWATVTSYTDVERINLAVCPANPAIVKAIAANPSSGLEGIYGSTDNGLSFTPLYLDSGTCTNNLLSYDLGLPSTACSGQGWYDLCIAIDPTDPNKVITGGINNYYSADGGHSWAIVSQWYGGLPGIATVHADKHWLAYNPLVPGALYQGCDGGIYETLDPTSTLWNDLTNGMGITEFYRNAVAIGDSFCIGGAQDNGTKMIASGVATDLTGGDGMVCQIDYADPANTWYTSFPNGDFDITGDGGVTYSDITNSIAGSPTGDWVTPLIIHPIVDGLLLLGYNALYVSYDRGGSWSTLSPVFAPGVNINSIVVPFTNGNYVYCATDDNNIHFSPDFGVTWNTITAPFSANISRLAVDPKNENILWISYNGYGTHKVASYNNTSSVWTIYDGTLPDVPVNCIIIDSSSETKYIGTDVAVFYMDTTMTDWSLYDNNLPAVIVNDLNINYGTNELWVATFGRGMWKTQKYNAPAPVDTTTTGVSSVNMQANNAIIILPNPNHGAFTINTNNSLLTAQPVIVKLLDASGKVVMVLQSAFDNSGNLKVNATNLPKGSYICIVSNRGMSARNKVAIE